MTKGSLLPRPLHPFAWWAWALALAVVANQTTNPLFLAGLVGVATIVTLARRGDNPWARSFALYLALGGIIVLVRVLIRILFGGGDGPTTLFTLPQIHLPAWVGGIRLLGRVSLESLLHGFTDGLRLATMIICLGAANALVNPKRLLAALPAALQSIGTLLVVTFSVLPQLAESITRVWRVRKLRKARATRTRRQRLGVVETIIVPVLSDALDRSVALAASMEARGYGHSGSAPRSARRWSTVLGLAGVTVLSVWAFFLLARPGIGPVLLGRNLVELLLLLAGLALVVGSLRVLGRHVATTHYRPDRWLLAEWITLGVGLAAVLVTQGVAAGPGARVLEPSIIPLIWPTLTWPLLVVLLLGVLPAFLTPPPALSTTANDHQEGLS